MILELKDITKQFDGTGVLRGISLSVRQGEFISLLGSSGCGKTTTLRIIAGLESPDAGRVFLGGQDVTGWEPNRRDVNTIFQNYALFPHMDVSHNISYGLKLRRVPKAEMREQVHKMLRLVQLEGYGRRMPSQLSGGQKQRVAIARALANSPKMLLLDEPLGALDPQLRRQMQAELKKLQKQLGITFLYVTHDQEEAINMSDRIVVMRDGRLEQIGTPSEIYDFPKTSYVAQFVGNANLIHGMVKSCRDGIAEVETTAGTVPVRSGPGLLPGRKATMAIRSENISLSRDTGTDTGERPGIRAIIREKTFLGGVLRIVLEAEGIGELISSRQGMDQRAEPGERVVACWKPEQAVLVDETEEGAPAGEEGL